MVLISPSWRRLFGRSGHNRSRVQPAPRPAMRGFLTSYEWYPPAHPKPILRKVRQQVMTAFFEQAQRRMVVAQGILRDVKTVPARSAFP